MTGAGARCGARSRQAVPRPRLVKFFLTDEELAALDEAAGQAGLPGARSRLRSRWQRRGAAGAGGFAVTGGPGGADGRGGLVRWIGTNLNQAVARLNATGQRGEDLLPAARMCARVIRRLDEAAEHVRRNVP